MLEAPATPRQKLGRLIRTGLICCFQSGCLQYSTRFVEETSKALDHRHALRITASFGLNLVIGEQPGFASLTLR